MKRLVLHIDTSQRDSTTVTLTGSGSRSVKRSAKAVVKSQALLPLIEEALHARKCRPEDIDEIIVAPGPGSYTGLRIGMAVANIFARLFDIPVNGKTRIPALPRYAG